MVLCRLGRKRRATMPDWLGLLAQHAAEPSRCRSMMTMQFIFKTDFPRPCRSQRPTSFTTVYIECKCVCIFGLIYPKVLIAGSCTCVSYTQPHVCAVEVSLSQSLFIYFFIISHSQTSLWSHDSRIRIVCLAGASHARPDRMRCRLIGRWMITMFMRSTWQVRRNVLAYRQVYIWRGAVMSIYIYIC